MAERLPPQGGLPPAAGLDGTVVEIACDESGFSGSNLLDPATPVITHAGVDLDVAEAADLLATVRSGRAPGEVKSGRFLRGTVPAGFLEALAGRAHVHVLDKELFLTTRLLELARRDLSYAAAVPDPAAAAVRAAAAGPGWGELLTAFVAVFRSRRRPRPGAVDALVRARDALAARGLPAPADVLAELDPAYVREVLAELRTHDPAVPPPLEPMIPALAATVLSFGRRVLVVHDEQSALTAGRLRRLQHALATDGPSPLAGLVTVDSRDDPRVQVADLLAGLARRRPGTPALLPLLAPRPTPGARPSLGAPAPGRSASRG